jgi:hypothetical protein
LVVRGWPVYVGAALYETLHRSVRAVQHGGPQQPTQHVVLGLVGAIDAGLGVQQHAQTCRAVLEQRGARRELE